MPITSACEKTSSDLESIRRATKEKSQIRYSHEGDFSFFTDAFLISICNSNQFGNNVTIGANVVVTNSVPDGQTVLPSKMITLDKDLSPYYIHNTSN